MKHMAANMAMFGYIYFKKEPTASMPSRVVPLWLLADIQIANMLEEKVANNHGMH